MAVSRRLLIPVLVLPLAAGALGVTGLASAATTVPTFARTDHPSLANHIISADLNGDGRLDLAGLGLDSAAVLLSNGDGTFGGRALYPVADDGQDLAAGDFDRDGDLDLVVTINSAQTSVSVLRGNGDGTFAARVDYPNTSGFDSPAVLATDLDDDAVLDLVVAHSIACFTAPCRVATTVSVMRGNGDGTFQAAREVEVGRGIAEIAGGDFNRDGIKDLAFAGDSSRLYRLQGVGDGTFVQQPTITMTADTLGVDATDVDVADFNGDAVEDLVVATALNGSRTAVMLGNGDGSFRQPLILTDPGLHVPQYVAVADYNLDGFQDLAMALGNGNGGLMQLRNGNGDGTFQAPVNQLVPPNQSSIGGVAILSARLDSDTRPDIALAWGGASTGLAVLLNRTGSAPPATPGAPTLLSPGQDATVSQPVVLDWSDVAAATTYRVQVDDSSTFSSPLVVDSTVSTSQVTAPTLAARQHWWRVRGINSAGVVGAWSSVRRFTPRAVSPPTGQTATLTVTASGRSGERVQSTPTGINVLVGSTGSASFTVGTSVRLSVTNSREAIWSGACSSGGNRARTCTFTLNGSASVTANVR